MMKDPQPIKDPDFDCLGWDKKMMGANCPDRGQPIPMNKIGERSDPQDKHYGVQSVNRPAR